MLEICLKSIQDLIEQDCYSLSGSVAELGSNAAQFTWNNALEYSKKYPLLKNTSEVLEAKAYFRSFGAWSDEEVSRWGYQDVNALLVQEVASDVKEALEIFDSLEEIEEYEDSGDYYLSLFWHENELWIQLSI